MFLISRLTCSGRAIAPDSDQRRLYNSTRSGSSRVYVHDIQQKNNPLQTATFFSSAIPRVNRFVFFSTAAKAPWRHHIMESQWKHHGSTMKAPWKLETPRKHRKQYEVPMEAPCSTELPSNSHGTSMEGPWKHHGSPHGSSMEVEAPWKSPYRHCVSMQVPWKHHRSTMESP